MSDRVMQRLLSDSVVDRIWGRDPGVFAPARDDAGVARAILNRLGWLTVPEDMQDEAERVRLFAEAARAEGLDRVLLLGMGGSSLCAEVLREIGGTAPGWPDLVVLDTTDEATIARESARLDPARTLFIVASKSGSTIEVTSLERHFRALTERALGRNAAGRRFVAITDPGTPLVPHAREQGYRDLFINPPDIGGRFSALSLFGLVPAALLGQDLDELLASGRAMAEGCREQAATNPGLALGAFMVASAEAGRDKLTLLLPPSFMSLGLWVEQLVAESTGKKGVGLLPVTGEPMLDPATIGNDRAFIVVSTDEDQSMEDVGRRFTAGSTAGAEAPACVFTIRTRRTHLGSEFFRWEFATAVAGAGLGINPFDEPNVKEAKDQTSALLSDRSALVRDLDATRAPLAFFTGEQRPADAGALGKLLASAEPGDYCSLLVWLTPDAALEDSLQNIRGAITRSTGTPTTIGIGPRYLHSTGQYHKGGPDTGVFIVITADDEGATEVPEAGYSFSMLKRAQALGDLRALVAHKRRVLRVHLGRGVENPGQLLEQAFETALSGR